MPVNRSPFLPSALPSLTFPWCVRNQIISYPSIRSQALALVTKSLLFIVLYVKTTRWGFKRGIRIFLHSLRLLNHSSLSTVDFSQPWQLTSREESSVLPSRFIRLLWYRFCLSFFFFLIRQIQFSLFLVSFFCFLSFLFNEPIHRISWKSKRQIFRLISNATYLSLTDAARERKRRGNHPTLRKVKHR